MADPIGTMFRAAFEGKAAKSNGHRKLVFGGSASLVLLCVLVLMVFVR